VRSTRAHNTVMIAGREQSEVWGTFRLARQARVRNVEFAAGGNEFQFVGEYSPYYAADVFHRREVTRLDDGWHFRDTVTGWEDVSIQSFLHFHPDLEVREEEGRFIASHSELLVEVMPFGFDRAALGRGTSAYPQGLYCPEFGVSLPAPVLVMEIDRNDGCEFGYTIRRPT
jgi:hypothetical protein